MVSSSLVVCLVLSSLPALAGTGSHDPPEILVSRQLLAQRGLEVGEVVRLSADPSGAGARELRIVGVYEPMADPMRLGAKRFEARLHLPDLLPFSGERFTNDSVGAIAVRLTTPEQDADFRRELGLRTPGLTIDSPVAAESADLFRVLERFHVAISIVTVLGSTAFLLALMVMRAEERREIAGILRVVGFSRPRILLQVLLEGTFVAVAGAAFGVAFAVAMQGFVNAFFQWHYDTSLIFVRVTPRIAACCVALAVPLGTIAGLVASWGLLRRNAVDLLRR